MREIVLVENKTDCCGCGACLNACPHHAITMKADDYGFAYPSIDAQKCVGCGLCKTVCAFGKENDLPAPIGAYAVQAREDGLLKRSASGGVFAMLAQVVLEQGGAAVGCAMERMDGRLTPHHVVIESSHELPKLQGSKYVQSDTENVYCQIRELLNSGRKVLFSGTPCQVDGLRHFLRGKDYPGLFTVDLICHGVPNSRMFADSIGVLEKKLNGTVLDFKFREKREGWGLNGCVTYSDGQNVHSKIIPSWKSSYYQLFLLGEIYRESCYHCKYACLSRPGDLTIGDFWGIEQQHPEALAENGGELSVKKGISCVLVNTERGRELLDALSSRAKLVVSQVHGIARENAQLNHPSHRGSHRNKIMEMYKKGGYAAVDRWFYFYSFRRKVKKRIASMLRKIRH